jgi:hypothetical protein
VGFFLIDLRELIEGMREVGNAYFEFIKIGLGYFINMADDRTFEAWVVKEKILRASFSSMD